MTCGQNTIKLDGEGFAVITRDRASSGHLLGAPASLCRYNRPPEVEAEYLTQTADAAIKLYKDAQSAAGLTGIRLRWGKGGPQLVRVSIPSGDYIDFWSVKRNPVPTGFGPEIGNGYARLGHPGIAAELRVAPPPGTTNLEICVFLTAGGLRVHQIQVVK
jgi:hypothetical protein